MAEKSPLVFVDGGFSQLPPGDSIEGLAYGSVTAGSGLVGGGDLSTGSKQVDVGLAASPSGVIFVGDSIGLDGVDVVLAGDAYSSGVVALEQADEALASGVAAQDFATAALASGNAALSAAVNFVDPTYVQFTSASDIKAGYAVGLDDAGKVQSIRNVPNPNGLSFESSVVFNSATTAYPFPIYDSANNRVVFAYRDGGNSFYGTAIVGTVSGASISFGTAVVFESASSAYISATYDSNSSQIVIAYQDIGTSSRGTAIVGAVSGTSISFGSPAVFDSSSCIWISATYNSTDDKVVIAYQDGGNSNYGTAVVGTVSGTSISFGTAVVFESANTTQIYATYDSTNNRVVIAYLDVVSPFYGTAIVGTVSGTSISFGTAVIFNGNTSGISATYNSSDNRVVISYRDATNSSYGTAIVGTVSGTSISFGTGVVFESASTKFTSATYNSTDNRVVIAYQDDGNLDYGTAVLGTVSGTSISFSAPVVFESSSSNSMYSTYDSSNNRVVIGYQNTGNSNYGTAVVASPSLRVGPIISSLNNFIGVARNTVASGANVDVLLPRAVDYNQTSLTPGLFYYVDPTTSGFVSTSGQPSTWSGAYNWSPVAKAVSSSGLLLLDTL